MLLLLLLAIASACESDFVDYSRMLCANSPKCYSNFYLDQPNRFASLLDYALEQVGLEQEQICNCTDPALYVALLESYHFCRDNEIFTPSYDCICRHDKLCDEKKPSDFTMSNILVVALLFVILGTTTYFSGKVLTQLWKRHIEEEAAKKKRAKVKP